MRKIHVESRLIIVIAVSLFIGFAGGVVVTAYKTPSIVAQLPQAPNDPPSDQEIKEHIKNLRDEVATNPQNFLAWVQLGNAFFDIDSHENAIEAYQKALELSPDNPDVLTDLGIMYRRNKQPRKAIEYFEKAARIDPNHLQSRFNKGIVLLHDLDDKNGAIVAWQEVATLRPDYALSTGQTIQQLIDSVK